MPTLAPGLYVTPNNIGWTIIQEPGENSKGAYSSPPYTCADIVRCALELAKETRSAVFVMHPKDNMYIEVLSDDDIPPWCHSFTT